MTNMDIQFSGDGDDASNIINGFKKFMRDRSSKNRLVKKTLTVKPEWKAKFEDLYERAHNIKTEELRIDNLTKSLWSEICLSLNDFSDMRYNRKTNELEILADDGEENGVPSPYRNG